VAESTVGGSSQWIVDLQRDRHQCPGLKITAASRPRRSDRVLKQEAEGSVVLLSIDSGAYFALDVLGGRVWDFCTGDLTVREMASCLETDYDAPAATIEEDLVELLSDLAREKLVHDP